MLKQPCPSHVTCPIGHHLLFLISNGKDALSMRNELKISRRVLSHHLTKLRRLGLIEQTQQHPYGVYRLTSLGVHVTQKLRQSEKQSLFRCHDLIVGFNILSFGSFNFLDNSHRKIIPMQNWKYAREEIRGFVINIQETGLLKIYCPQKYSTSPDDAFAKMYAEASSIAQEYCDRFNMKMGELKVVRKGHKSLVNSENFAKLLGKVNFGDVWVDESNGTGELEARQDNYSIEELLKVPTAIAQITPIIIQQQEINAEFSKNLKLHLEVLTGIRNELSRFSNTIDKLEKSLNKANA